MPQTVQDPSPSRQEREAHEDKVVFNYRLGRKLGSGRYAKVFLAEHLVSKRKVAAKIIRKSKMLAESEPRSALSDLEPCVYTEVYRD